MARLEIRLLGGFEVRRGDTVLRGFESQKVRALLAYLACHADQAQSRTHLAGLLWPEEKPTWTAGAILLAADALTEHTAASKLFCSVQLLDAAAGDSRERRLLVD